MKPFLARFLEPEVELNEDSDRKMGEINMGGGSENRRDSMGGRDWGRWGDSQGLASH